MMRIAKIADGDVDGGGNPGCVVLGAAAGGAADSGDKGDEGDESARKRGGGSLRGRGGDAIGRSAFAVSFANAASAASTGSDGVRALPEAFVSPPSEIDGLERRRIGGG
jgi:hypothetical protein